MKKLNEIILLIKPQFECGVELSKKYKGIVLNKNIHINIIKDIIIAFKKIDYVLEDLTYSPITGGDGNIEYLAYFKKNGINNAVNVETKVYSAFANFKKM